MANRGNFSGARPKVRAESQDFNRRVNLARTNLPERRQDTINEFLHGSGDLPGFVRPSGTTNFDGVDNGTGYSDDIRGGRGRNQGRAGSGQQNFRGSSGRGRGYGSTSDMRSNDPSDRGRGRGGQRGRGGSIDRATSEFSLNRQNDPGNQQTSQSNQRGLARGSRSNSRSGDNHEGGIQNRGRGRGRGDSTGRGGIGRGYSCDGLAEAGRPNRAWEENQNDRYGSMQNMSRNQGGRGAGYKNAQNPPRSGGPGRDFGPGRDCPVLSNKELEVMDQRSAEDNTFFLLTNIDKLEATLNSQNAKPERVELLLKLFAKLCQSLTLALNIQKIMLAIASSEFFLGQVSGYMNRHDINPEFSLVHMMIIFRYLLNNFPTQSHGKITLMLPHLQLVFAKKPMVRTPVVMEEYDKVEVLHDALTDRINRGDCLDDDNADVDEDDFTNKPILPNVEDVGPGSEPPDLKENIVYGKYKSAYQYLDTQFSLLREDLIGPLRAGIKQYREYKEQRKEVSRLDDGYCYNNVKLLRVESKSKGLACRVQFDISHMKRIKWESSKRLLHGNLVCLSSDDFESIICATVEERETKDLVQGQVVLLLASGLMTMLGDRRNWTMIEATSYLESYRYVLLRLQQLGEDMDYEGARLPFERYFLKCQTTVEPPRYLTENPEMDFGVMDIEPEQKTREERIEAINTAISKLSEVFRTLYASRFVPEEDASIDMFEKMLRIKQSKKSVINVLDSTNWKELVDLGLDNSQLAALQNAITHELSVIQGPPGTGKTYIGLKFVELLLSNRELWKYDQNVDDSEFIGEANRQNHEDRSHIMVMCYTNHALDQFLEGILDLEGKIGTNMVRIGGRCKNERLEPYTLRKKGHPRREVYQARDRTRDEIKRLDDMLNKRMKAFNYKPSDLALRKVVSVLPEMHFDSLRQCGLDIVEAIIVWLDGASQDQVSNKRYKETLTQTKSLNPGAVEDERIPGSDLEEEARFREKLQLLEADVKEQQFERELDADDWMSERKPRNKKKGKEKKAEADQNIILPVPMRRRLDRIAPMEPDVADNVVDVWKLANNHRLGLYLNWCSTHLESQDIKVQQILKDLKAQYDILDEINKEVDYEAIRNSEIIGLTTTGASKYHDLIQRVKPKIVIVEEAAEVLEAHIVTALTDNCEHLVLIGDHKQLRPNPTMYKLARYYNLDISLFERMVRNKLPVSTLEFQHRMRPEISQFLVPHIYPMLKDHQKVFTYDHVKGLDGDVVFLNHSVPEDGVEDTRSHTNDHEAALVVGLCDYLLIQGYEPTQITVLTMYSGQMFQVRKRMRYAHDRYYGIRVVPVDNYQGEENDIVIMSYVRSNAFGKIGFLKASNRICVSISRAKIGFYCFGNFTMYAKARGSDVWKGLLADVLKQGMLKDHIPFCCTNHKTLTKIFTEEDFQKVPCGGCAKPCSFRLPCGHVCALSCHPYDPAHTEYQCLKPCERKCRNGHKSCTNKCFEECLPCPTLILVKKDDCGHEYKTPCFKEDEPCPQPCERLLPCDHICSELCGAEQCTTLCPRPCKRLCKNNHKTCKLACYNPCLPCKVNVLVTQEECGHVYPIACHKENDPCPEPCKKVLLCGHNCSYSCSKICHYETQCTVVILVERDCGHKYNTHCMKKDFPCQKPCNKKIECGHMCKNSCSEICTASSQCTEPCNRQLPCSHLCKKLCYQTCQSRFECEIVVDKALPCGHIAKVPCKNKLDAKQCEEPVVVSLPCNHRKQVKCCYSNDPKALQCKVKVKYQLDCKHEITTPCFEREKPKKCEFIVNLELPCTHEAKVKCHVAQEGSHICKVKTKKKLPCGHHWDIDCHIDVKDVICKAECTTKLECGHICQGSCSVCQIAHQKCQKKCQKRLICSHSCESQCGDPCGPCEHKSEYRCSHKEYRKAACSGLSISCQLACMWQCPHHACSKRCSQRCDRPPCDEPCWNRLNCNHLCMGLCGEPCPVACPKCRPRLFGKFGRDKTRCVSLHPCGHAIPVERMDGVMERNVLGDFTEVSVKYCPLQSCTKPVLFCPRYGAVINEYLHIMSLEHKQMNKASQIKGRNFTPDQDLLQSYTTDIEDVAKYDAKIFKKMPDYSAMVTSLRLRLLSTSRSKLGEEEYNIIRAVAECSLLHLQYMKATQRCAICYRDRGCSKDCRCPSPLDRFKSLDATLDTTEKIGKLYTKYQAMESLSFIKLTPIEMANKDDLPVKTTDNKWYRCRNGHFLCLQSGKKQADLRCEKCDMGEPGDLDVEERQAAQRVRLPVEQAFQLPGGFGRGRGRGRGGGGRGGRRGGRRGRGNRR